MKAGSHLFIKNKNINLNLEEIEIIEIEQIIKFIAMVSPFSNIDKQALLETKDDLEFFKKLISILELEIAGDFLIIQLINSHSKITYQISDCFIFFKNI